MNEQTEALEKKLKQTHCDLHRTAGTVETEKSLRAKLADGRMEAHGVSDDAVRLKAYELWEARGKVDGRDKEDWFAALGLLERRADVTAASGLPKAASTDLLTEGVRAATSVALGAVRAVEELFGMRGDHKDVK